MNTVQWWLNHVDEGDLTNTFFSIYPVDYEHTSDLSKSVHQTQSYEKLRFLTFLYNLRNLKVKASLDERIFFAVPRYECGDDSLTTCLCQVEDLRDLETPETLSWLLVDYEELMGYWIADTELTTSNILFVLCKILYVASFLGYTGKFRDLYRELSTVDPESAEGAIEKEATDDDATANALRQDILHAELTYNDYCFQREVNSLRAILSSK